MYHEGLQILYGENLFTFDQTAAMELFRDDGLLQVPCAYSVEMRNQESKLTNVVPTAPKNQYSKIASFEFLPNAQGRFALIRNLLLKLAGGMSAMPSWTGFLQAGRCFRTIHSLSRQLTASDTHQHELTLATILFCPHNTAEKCRADSEIHRRVQSHRATCPRNSCVRLLVLASGH